MSLFADYKKEREGKEAIEVDNGFVTYKVYGDSVYIEDIFVSKEQRRTGLASQLADMVVIEAKKQGCLKLLGTVDPGAIGASDSLKALMAYGFKISPIQNPPPLWWFVKEI